MDFEVSSKHHFFDEKPRFSRELHYLPHSRHIEKAQVQRLISGNIISITNLEKSIEISDIKHTREHDQRTETMNIPLFSLEEDQAVEKENLALNCLRDLSAEEEEIEFISHSKAKQIPTKKPNDDSINLSRKLNF